MGGVGIFLLSYFAFILQILLHFIAEATIFHAKSLASSQQRKKNM